MTVKKAIDILDLWISHKKLSKKQLKEEWNYDADKATEVARALMDSEEQSLEALLADNS